MEEYKTEDEKRKMEKETQLKEDEDGEKLENWIDQEKKM